MRKRLPKALQGRIFLLSEALAYRISKATLTRMVQSNQLERVGRGIYQAVGDHNEIPESSYVVATMQCGLPSAICLLSALEHYQVTNHISKQTWIMVSQSKRVVSKHLKLIRTRNPHWEIGIRKTNNYWITTLERTLVDCLLYKQKVGSQTVLEALRKAISQNKVKLGAIYDTAKKLGVAHRIRPYIEVLAA